VYFIAWQQGDEPAAAWKVDNAGAFEAEATRIEARECSHRFVSDFNKIDHPRAWVEYQDVQVWQSADGTIMLRE
jgi:hypothetical protein